MDNAPTLTEQELSAFAHKLNAWSATLDARERDFLNQMLADAAFVATSDGSGYIDLESALDDDDVQGFDMDPAMGLTASIFEYGRGVTRSQGEALEIQALGV
ncbi:MAG: hypothetical protein AB7N24_12485 [Dehalococcoidia bacterium]